MVVSLANQIEHNIRTKVDTKRIRPSEFFLDYDRLRSGYVTGEYKGWVAHWVLNLIFEYFTYFNIWANLMWYLLSSSISTVELC